MDDAYETAIGERKESLNPLMKSMEINISQENILRVKKHLNGLVMCHVLEDEFRQLLMGPLKFGVEEINSKSFKKDTLINLAVTYKNRGLRFSEITKSIYKESVEFQRFINGDFKTAFLA